MAIVSGDAAHYSQLVLDDLDEAQRLGFNLSSSDRKTKEWYTKKVGKYGPRIGKHRAYAEEFSTDMPITNVRNAVEAAHKCKDEAIATSNAVWRAIHSRLRRQERPVAPVPV